MNILSLTLMFDMTFQHFEVPLECIVSANCYHPPTFVLLVFVYALIILLVCWKKWPILCLVKRWRSVSQVALQIMPLERQIGLKVNVGRLNHYIRTQWYFNSNRREVNRLNLLNYKSINKRIVKLKRRMYEQCKIKKIEWLRHCWWTQRFW